MRVFIDTESKWTEEYRKEYYKKYRQENKEKAKNVSSEYYARHRMHLVLYRREYIKNNKEKISIARKESYKNNRTQILEEKQRYYRKNIERIKEYRCVTKEHSKNVRKENHRENRVILNAKARERIKNDIQYKLRVRLRARLYNAIKSSSKEGSAVKDLGCSISFLKEYLEYKWLPDMNWSNWSFEGWHIDHIIPLGTFNLTDRRQFLKACHYTNLQPLWGIDNMRKGKKIL